MSTSTAHAVHKELEWIPQLRKLESCHKLATFDTFREISKPQMQTDRKKLKTHSGTYVRQKLNRQNCSHLQKTSEHAVQYDDFGYK